MIELLAVISITCLILAATGCITTILMGRKGYKRIQPYVRRLLKVMGLEWRQEKSTHHGGNQ